MNSKPITQRAKSSPFKVSAADMIGPIATSLIAGIDSGAEKVVKEEEEEPTKTVVSKKEEKPKTFAQSLVSGIESGKQKK